VIELQHKLFEVLTEPAIIATPTGDIAAWLPGGTQLIYRSLQFVIGMVSPIDYSITLYLYHNTHTLQPTAQSQRGTPGEAQGVGIGSPDPDLPLRPAQQAVQLAALVCQWPQLVWDYPGWEGTLSIVMALRAVCMLAVAGLLTGQQKQGVVALLGGVPGDSTNSSSPIPRPPLLEPFSLAALRQEGGISLAELSVAFLDEVVHQPPGHTNQFASIIVHLLLIFGAQQLPAIQQAFAAVADSPADKQQGSAYLGQGQRLREVVSQKWEQGPLRVAYLEWVQASLLRVIEDVLSPPRPFTI
jgi:hypothetical protein